MPPERCWGEATELGRTSRFEPAGSRWLGVLVGFTRLLKVRVSTGLAAPSGRVTARLWGRGLIKGRAPVAAPRVTS
jgi:hypothetical protein